jgi:two-component system nitrogen regulation response regulator GlnG/two-component system response regulator HydG
VSNETTIPERSDTAGTLQTPRTALVLVVAWCGDDPARVGEVLLGPPGPPGPTVWLGRGRSLPGERPKVSIGQHRPGQWIPSPALSLPALSRYQLALAALSGDRLRLRNEGRCTLMVNDEVVDGADVAEGDVVQLGKQLLFICVRRALGLAPEGAAAADFPFGAPDRHGIVGESQAAWELRAQVAQIAGKEGHVLITGESGSGKELVAQAIHALSPRAGRRMVARNAATLPGTLIDAELFGNARNYPNPGMAERPGLIGEAHQSTLLLDEFAELPHEAQTHLLRVLDAGEYHRLGESQSRRSSFRLLAATNRDLGALKHDVLGRFQFHVAVPFLGSRRDDIPLLIHHLVRTQPELAGLTDEDGRPRVPLRLLGQLLRHQYRTGVRELRTLLWQSSSGGEPTTAPTARASRSDSRLASAGGPTADQVRRCLDENNGALEPTWRALGLKNRFALLRLVKRYDLEIRRRPGRR